MRGPVAPKDPTKKRPKIYLLLEDNLATENRSMPQPAEIIYLEGRIPSNLAIICPELPKELLEQLATSEGFYQIVHSIGVSVEPAKEEFREEVLTCDLQHYGKTEKYTTGTHMKMEVLCDGAERVFPVEEFEKSGDDSVLGTLCLLSNRYDLQGKITITLYLNDGYTVPEPVLDPPVDFQSEAYRELLARSLYSIGNTSRLRRVIEKAEAGEDVTIAFIGGSITQGAGAKPIATESYVYKVFSGFCKNYATHPEKVHLIKAGLGGTSSELGLLRYEHDVLRDGSVEPDLVVIEFAVNDEGDETKGICYESLMAKAWNHPHEPAVILLFSVFMNDWNLQERLAPIGLHYDIPMVSVRNAVSPQFGKPEGRVITKRQYFHDCFHPTNDGHQVMADCVLYLLEQSLAHVSETHSWPKDGCLGRMYEQAITITRNEGNFYGAGVTVEAGSFTDTDASLQSAEMDLETELTPQFPKNWKRSSTSESAAPFRVVVECRSFFLIFKDAGDGIVGRAQITIDGVKTVILDPHEVGWTHCNAKLLIPDGEKALHTIEVTPADGEENKQFTILAFAYVK